MLHPSECLNFESTSDALLRPLRPSHYAAGFLRALVRASGVFAHGATAVMICLRVRTGLLGGGVDVLSEVLKVVKLQGAMFYNGEIFFPVEFLFASLPHGCALSGARRRARNHLSLAH